MGPQYRIGMVVLITETENIFCNKITPPEFTAEQVANCQKCRHISGKKIWCCHFGLTVVEGGKIIQPFPKDNIEFNRDRPKRNYAVAVDMAKDSGKEIIDEDVFVNRRQICSVCPPIEKQGCPCIGCKQWPKLVFKEVKCPKEKW